jgi:hypothetical protein
MKQNKAALIFNNRSQLLYINSLIYIIIKTKQEIKKDTLLFRVVVVKQPNCLEFESTQYAYIIALILN